LSVLWGHMPP